MPDYFSPRFTLRQAANASDFPYNTMRSYYQRGWFKSFSSALSQGRGRTGQLCLADVLVLSIASRLIEVGVRPLNAYADASSFAVIARTPKGFDRRKPLQLFDQERYQTVFVWQPGASPRVVPLPKADARIQLGELFYAADPEEYASAAVVIPLNPLEALVFRRLKIENELEGAP